MEKQVLKIRDYGSYIEIFQDGTMPELYKIVKFEMLETKSFDKPVKMVTEYEVLPGKCVVEIIPVQFITDVKVINEIKKLKK